MNNRIVVMAIATLSLMGCNSIAVRGSGNPYEVRHDVGRITEVEVNGSGELRIENGEHPQLIVLAQGEIHQHLDVQVHGDRLIIEPEEGYHFKTHQTLQYLLIIDDLQLIRANGAVNVTSQEFNSHSLMIDANGATDLDMTVYADNLTIDAAGSFDGYLAGEVNTLTLDFSGSSDIQAYDLTAAEVDLDISGAGTAFVTATEQLNVSAAGASSVTYRGNPRVSQSSAGASFVRAAE